MAGIKVPIVLQDKASSVLRNIARRTSDAAAGFKNIGAAGNNAFSKAQTWYRNATQGQQTFNWEIERGADLAGGLADKIKGLVAGYAWLKTVQTFVNLSDTIAQTEARIGLMNDGMQTTGELMAMIHEAANRSRGSFQDMADVVAKLGNNARGAFKGSAEVVAFAEAIQKQFVASGTGAQEASNAMLQLTQALGSGVLRGDELRSVMEQAPGIVKLIAKEMGTTTEKIRDAAAEGKITADIVKNAVLNNIDDINADFEKMPMTWQGVWTRMRNDALAAVKPLLNVINALANNKAIQMASKGILTAISLLANGLTWVLDKANAVVNFFAENWGTIAPIILGVAAVVGTYNLMLHASSIASLAAAAAAKIHEIAQRGLGVAIAFANSKLLIAVAIIAAVVAAIVAVAAHIAKTGGVANSTLGVIMGGLNVVWAAIKNTGLIIANVGLGIWNAINALCHNIGVAFHNSIARVKSTFYSLLSTAMEVIGKIANALSKLPFVNFDASGITSAASNFASKAADAAASVQEYSSVSAAFQNGFNTFDAFGKNWAKDAYAQGAAWGDSKSELIKGKISDFKNNFLSATGTDAAEGYGSTLNTIADNTGANGTGGETADNTASIAKSLATTNEELSWIRDIAERDVINRFTTAEVKIDMTGMTNTISGDKDLDGVISKFVTSVEGALRTTAAGVY